MYTVNTLMWLLMSLNGINPKTHSADSTEPLSREQICHATLIRELQRVQNTMGQIKEGETLGNMMRVDKEAAKRFIKHGLGLNKDNWDGEHANEQDPEIIT